MSFISAKCPNCGASINVDPNAETAICMSCGSALIPKEAIELRKVDAKVDGISTNLNTLVRGQQCLEAQDWVAAVRYFSSVIDNQADSFEAWYGLLRAYTHDFTLRTLGDIIGISTRGEKGLNAVLQNCKKYSSSAAYDESSQIDDGIRKGGMIKSNGG